MNIKQIIKEEMDWIQDVSNVPLTDGDKAELIEKFIEENEEQLKEAEHFVGSFWKQYSSIRGNFSVNDLRNVVTLMFSQQFKY